MSFCDRQCVCLTFYKDRHVSWQGPHLPKMADGQNWTTTYIWNWAIQICSCCRSSFAICLFNFPPDVDGFAAIRVEWEQLNRWPEHQRPVDHFHRASWDQLLPLSPPTCVAPILTAGPDLVISCTILPDHAHQHLCISLTMKTDVELQAGGDDMTCLWVHLPNLLNSSALQFHKSMQTFFSRRGSNGGSE